MSTDTISIPITDRESWLEMRRQDVTASDIAAVCGVHPTRSALQVWSDKFMATDQGDNAMMRRGRWLEDAVIFAMRERFPAWTISKPGLYVRSASLRIGATPDAIGSNGMNDRFVIQCKVVARSVFEGWDDAAPLHYQLQVVTESKLMYPKAAMGLLAVLVIGEFSAELEVFEIPILDEAWERAKAGVAAWWADVNAGRKPRADYTKDGEVIARLYKSEDFGAPPVDLSSDNRLADICAEYQMLGGQQKVIEEQRKAYKAEIVEKLAGRPKAVCGPYKISNTTVEKGEYIVKASSHDRLTISIPKGKK